MASASAERPAVGSSARCTRLDAPATPGIWAKLVADTKMGWARLGEDFELAISTAASLGRQAIKEARELSVVSQRGPIRCETGVNLSDDMTRLAGPNRRGTAMDLARSL